jgi:hypothetical protein
MFTRNRRERTFQVWHPKTCPVAVAGGASGSGGGNLSRFRLSLTGRARAGCKIPRSLPSVLN